MSMKKIKIFIIVFLISLFGIALMNVPWFIDMNVIHEYSTITEFEKETGLQYYDLYDFKIYVDENKKELLREKKNFILHFNEETPNCYSIVSTIEDGNSYDIDFHFTNFLTARDYQIEHINDYTLYCYTYDDTDRIYFIAISNQFKYEFKYRNSKNLEESYIIEKAKEYVQMNDEYHKNKS